MLRPFRKGHCKINPKSPTSPPFFDFHPKRIDTKHITHTVSPCSTMKTKTSYFVWYSSRLWIKTSRSKKQIHLFFTRLFGFFTNLPLRGARKSKYICFLLAYSVFSLICRCAANIGGVSGIQTKTSYFVWYSSRLSLYLQRK